MQGQAQPKKSVAREKNRRRLLSLAVIVVCAQLALLLLALLLFDLLGHDLLCRYGAARWDPSDRLCYLPAPMQNEGKPVTSTP